MAINPLGPLKLLNFKDRVPKAVQKWRLEKAFASSPL